MAKRFNEQIEYGNTPERMDPNLERKLGNPENLYASNPAMKKGSADVQRLVSQRFQKVANKLREVTGIQDLSSRQIQGMVYQEMMRKLPNIMRIESAHRDELIDLAKDYSIVKNAKDLFDSMDDNTQLKAWIQSKLSKAEDYISSVRTYLDGESLTTTTPLVHNGEPVRDDEGAALNIGDVVKAADGKIYQVVFSYSEGKPFLTPFDLKRRKPMNLRERHYFDNVSEEMNKTLKMSKVMEYTATKGGFMR
jgi:hypothetical protein